MQRQAGLPDLWSGLRSVSPAGERSRYALPQSGPFSLAPAPAALCSLALAACCWLALSPVERFSPALAPVERCSLALGPATLCLPELLQTLPIRSMLPSFLSILQCSKLPFGFCNS